MRKLFIHLETWWKVHTTQVVYHHTMMADIDFKSPRIVFSLKKDRVYCEIITSTVLQSPGSEEGMESCPQFFVKDISRCITKSETLGIPDRVDKLRRRRRQRGVCYELLFTRTNTRSL